METNQDSSSVEGVVVDEVVSVAVTKQQVPDLAEALSHSVFSISVVSSNYKA